MSGGDGSHYFRLHEERDLLHWQPVRVDGDEEFAYAFNLCELSDVASARSHAAYYPRRASRPPTCLWCLRLSP